MGYCFSDVPGRVGGFRLHGSFDAWKGAAINTHAHGGKRRRVWRRLTMDWIPVNWALLKHPMNYVVVFLMVLLPLSVLSVAADKMRPDK